MSVLQSIHKSDQQMKKIIQKGLEQNPPKLNPLNPPELPVIDILAPLRDFATWLIEQVVTLVNQLYATIRAGFDWLVGEIIRVFKAGIYQLVSSVRDAYHRILVGDIEGAISASIPILTTFLGINISLVASGVRFAGSGVDTTGIIQAVERIFNPSMITGAFIGALFGSGVHTPLTYLANRMFEPTIPSPREGFEMWVRNLITRQKFDFIMSCHGLSAEWRDKLIDVWYFLPPPRFLFAMLRRGKIGYGEFYDLMRANAMEYAMIDKMEDAMARPLYIGEIAMIARLLPKSKNWIRNVLYERGFREVYLDDVTNMIWKRIYEDELRLMVREYEADYVWGYVTKEELYYIYELAGLRDVEKTYRLKAISRRLHRNLAKLKADVYFRLYRTGVIDDKTLYDKLCELDIEPDFAETYTNRERADKGLPPMEYGLAS